MNGQPQRLPCVYDGYAAAPPPQACPTPPGFTVQNPGCFGSCACYKYTSKNKQKRRLMVLTKHFLWWFEGEPGQRLTVTHVVFLHDLEEIVVTNYGCSTAFFKPKPGQPEPGYLVSFVKDPRNDPDMPREFLKAVVQAAKHYSRTPLRIVVDEGRGPAAFLPALVKPPGYRKPAQKLALLKEAGLENLLPPPLHDDLPASEAPHSFYNVMRQHQAPPPPPPYDTHGAVLAQPVPPPPPPPMDRHARAAQPYDSHAAIRGQPPPPPQPALHAGGAPATYNTPPHGAPHGLPEDQAHFWSTVIVNYSGGAASPFCPKPSGFVSPARERHEPPSARLGAFNRAIPEGQGRGSSGYVSTYAEDVRGYTEPRGAQQAPQLQLPPQHESFAGVELS